ncbi:hypothetical protein E8E01_24110 [Methylorubrum populi]|nr:hypothetical protein E8E01_24110 [Methylorubrum populi]
MRPTPHRESGGADRHPVRAALSLPRALLPAEMGCGCRCVMSCRRRLPVRYERRTDIYAAFTSLAASRVTLNQFKRFCSSLQGVEAMGAPARK